MFWQRVGIGGLCLLGLGGATSLAISVAAAGKGAFPAALPPTRPKPLPPTFANPLVAAAQPAQLPPVASAKTTAPAPPSAPELEATSTVRQPPLINDAGGETSTIRVRIASQPNQLSIAVSTPTTIVLPDGTGVGETLAPGQWHEIKLFQQGFSIADHTFPNGIKLMPSEEGFVAVEGRWYRGPVRLVWDGQLMAINEIDLEQYLYGVVGAEMPAHWQSEALKAQAIAARSYALALMQQPPSVYWDIGNDEAFQVYRGVETEMDTTIAVVNDTRGLVLLRDDQVFLSQYASTDAISQAAHGGIGNSMSQVGAQVMASQGATMPEILARYYPGVSFGALD